jgi:uncharacterized protein (TIGR03067 family)
MKQLVMLTAAAAMLLGLDSVAFVLAGAASTGKDDAKGLAAMQGNWKVLRLRDNGKEWSPAKMAESSVVIKNDRLTILVKDQVFAELALKDIDPGKNPKQLDMIAVSAGSKAKPDLTVYKLDGNKFTIYTFVGKTSQEKRPSAYPTKETENDFDVIELERVAPPKGGNASAGEKNDAKDLFAQMEKKLTEADTIQLKVQAKLKAGKEEGTVKATILLGQGNKLRMDVVIEGGGKTVEVTAVSNGTRAKAVSNNPKKGFEEKDTPKHLRENLLFSLTREGFTPLFMKTQQRDQTIAQKDNMLVSDLRLDKRDAIDGREVHVLHYQYAYQGEKAKWATTLFIDVKTLLPVLRTVPDLGNLREEYQYRLNEKIAEDQFELPK